MRKAVLIVNYITLGLIINATLNLDVNDPNYGLTLFGFFLFLPSVVLALIYAHSNKEK